MTPGEDFSTEDVEVPSTQIGNRSEHRTKNCLIFLIQIFALGKITLEQDHILHSLSFLKIEELVEVAGVSHFWHDLCQQTVEVRTNNNKIAYVKMMPLKNAPEWHRKGWHFERHMKKIREIGARGGALCQACFMVDYEAVLKLLSEGADVLHCSSCEYPDFPWEDSPLGHTVSTPNGTEEELLKIARLLMRFGADVDQMSPYGSTALHNSAQQGRLMLVRYLVLMCGADIELESISGLTALQWTNGQYHEQYDGNESSRAAVADFLNDIGRQAKHMSLAMCCP